MAWNVGWDGKIQIFDDMGTLKYKLIVFTFLWTDMEHWSFELLLREQRLQFYIEFSYLLKTITHISFEIVKALFVLIIDKYKIDEERS